MCGRFTRRNPTKELAEFFRLQEIPHLPPRYNIAPSQQIAAVRLDPEREQRKLVTLRWGLVPFWADEPNTEYSMINARAETVAKKPSYRNAFQRRRCLIVADGFYEWQKANAKKQPYFIHMKDDRPFAFAGLWERWKGEGKEIQSCTIIVTDANELLEPIHDRMPVILSPDDYDVWLDPDFGDKKKLQGMLRSYSGEDLEAYPVSTVVNNPQNDVEDCLKRVEK